MIRILRVEIFTGCFFVGFGIKLIFIMGKGKLGVVLLGIGYFCLFSVWTF